MGSLPGHVLPGSFFIFFAIWRLIQTVRRLQFVSAARRWGYLASPQDSVLSPSRPCRSPRRFEPMEDSGALSKTSFIEDGGRVQTCGNDKELIESNCSSIRNNNKDNTDWMHKDNNQDIHRRPDQHDDKKYDNIELRDKRKANDDNDQMRERNGGANASRTYDNEYYDDDVNNQTRDDYNARIFHSTLNNQQYCHNNQMTPDSLLDGIRSTNSDTRWDYFTSATYPCYFPFCFRFPVEAAVKLLVTAVGMGLELGASSDFGKQGYIRWMGNIQHVTMYSGFFLSGVVDLLRWFDVSFVPRGADYLALAQAFAGECLLFRNHNHGVEELEHQLHSRLTFIITCNSLAILFEYKYSHSLLAALASTYFIFLQGTWFYQVGLILYPPYDDWFMAFSYSGGVSAEDQLILADMIFMWHVGLDLLALGVLFVGTSLLFDRCCAPSRWETRDKEFVRQCATEMALVSGHQYLMTSYDMNVMSQIQCYHDNDNEKLCSTEDRSAATHNGCKFSSAGNCREANGTTSGKRDRKKDSLNNLLPEDETGAQVWSDDDKDEVLIYSSPAEWHCA